MKSISWILLVCLRSLIGCPQKQEIEKLVSELQDQDKNIRYNAARALGLIGEGAVSAVPTLMQALQDQDSNVRANTAEALGNIGTPEALKAVEEYQSQQ